MKKLLLLSLFCINSSVWAMDFFKSKKKSTKHQKHQASSNSKKNNNDNVLIITRSMAMALDLPGGERRRQEFEAITKSEEPANTLEGEAQRRAQFIIAFLENKLLPGKHKKCDTFYECFGNYNEQDLEKIYSGNQDYDVQTRTRQLIFEYVQEKRWGGAPIASEDISNQEDNK